MKMDDLSLEFCMRFGKELRYGKMVHSFLQLDRSGVVSLGRVMACNLVT
jgi:hypothetical protein